MRSPPWTRSSARPIPRRPTPARSRPSPPRLGRYRKGPRLTAMSVWRTLRPLLRRPVRAKRPVCEHAGVGTTNEIPRRVNGAGRWHSTFSVHSNSRVSGPFRNRSGSSVHPGGRHPWFRQMCSMLAPLTASQTVLVGPGPGPFPRPGPRWVAVRSGRRLRPCSDSQRVGLECEADACAPAEDLSPAAVGCHRHRQTCLDGCSRARICSCAALAVSSCSHIPAPMSSKRGRSAAARAFRLPSPVTNNLPVHCRPPAARSGLSLPSRPDCSLLTASRVRRRPAALGCCVPGRSFLPTADGPAAGSRSVSPAGSSAARR